MLTGLTPLPFAKSPCFARADRIFYLREDCLRAVDRKRVFAEQRLEWGLAGALTGIEQGAELIERIWSEVDVAGEPAMPPTSGLVLAGRDARNKATAEVW